MANCATPSNSGGKNCLENFGIITKVVICPAGTEIADVATAKLEATWTTLINAGRATRIFPWPNHDKFENPQEDPTFFEGDTNRKLVRSGNIRWVLSFANLPLCTQKMLKSFNGGEWWAYIITNKGYILGKSEDGVKVQPFKVNIVVDNQKFPGSNNDPYMTKAFIDLTYPDDWSDKGITALPTAFDPRELEGLTNVDLATSNPTTGGVTVTVTTDCDGAQVSGLVAGDFVLVDDAGGSETITGVTEPASNGVYVVAATIAADGYVINLKNQPSMTTKGYESTGSASFTVS